MDELVQPETAIVSVHTELVQEHEIGALKTERDQGIVSEDVAETVIVIESVKGLELKGSIAEWG